MAHSFEQVCGAVARGWCAPANASKEMDPDLAIAIAKEVWPMAQAERERCAKIAENMGRSNGRVQASHKRIADEIRAGTNRIGERH